MWFVWFSQHRLLLLLLYAFRRVRILGSICSSSPATIASHPIAAFQKIVRIVSMSSRQPRSARPYIYCRRAILVAKKKELIFPDLSLHARRLVCTPKDLLLAAVHRGETLSAKDASFASTKWGDIKHDKVAAKPFTAAARADKARVVAATEKAAFKAAQGAPDRGVFRAPGDGAGTFRVDASVAEIPGDFRMRLDERAGGTGKASRTIVQVLETGFYRGQAVTKVLLR